MNERRPGRGTNPRRGGSVITRGVAQLVLGIGVDG